MQAVRKDGIAFMKIDNYSSAISAYAKNAYKLPKKKLGTATVKNMDKTDFSTVSNAGTLESAKATVKMSVESFASPEKIAALKAMIADGSYNIPAESVAASILEG